MIEQMKEKMIRFYQGNTADISHFLKVHSLAALIGHLERLDEQDQQILEAAAIVHDIACPLCRDKYGNTAGNLQEKESAPLLEEFLKEFLFTDPQKERIIFLVCHHHTYQGVDGLDYQILLEADYLVNAGESKRYAAAAKKFRSDVFQTAAGIRLLEEMYPSLLQD